MADTGKAKAKGKKIGRNAKKQAKRTIRLTALAQKRFVAAKKAQV